MLKTACIFDREELQEFYAKINGTFVADNVTMYFALYEDGEVVGIIRMKPEDGKCRIFEADKVESLGVQEEEFLMKSGVNFALTFNAKHIIMSKHYEEYLLPMGFLQVGEELVGDTSKIDFPSKCCGK